MSSTSPYAGCCMLLTTRHAKSIAMAPPFWEQLGASMLEYLAEGDEQDTGTIYDSARRKCELPLEIPGVEYALASTARFEFHPTIPFLACHQEVLHFIDRKRGFQLSLTHFTKKTNYQMQVVANLTELAAFAARARFPSHGLLLRPNDATDTAVVLPAFLTQEALEEAFCEALSYSADGKVWVQTDMRAHRNPWRMAALQEATGLLAQRLVALCPACGAPGWGSACPPPSCFAPPLPDAPQILGCVLCSHTEVAPRSEKLQPIF